MPQRPRSFASERLRLGIAGIGIELTWEGARLLKEPAQKFFRGFVSKGEKGHPHVKVRLHCGELPSLEPDSLIFDAVTNHWRLFQTNGRSPGRYLFEFFDTRPPHLPIQRALMTTDFCEGELYYRPRNSTGRRSWSLPRFMRPFGELLLVNLLSQGRGVLIHGLGVRDRKEGLLFIGRSGAGKSTLAKLYKPFQDVVILGDERVVVTQAGGQFWLSGTPWPGEAFTVSPETVPLRKIFFLEHGPRNEFIADRVINLCGLFVQQMFLPYWNSEALGFALAFAEQLIRTLPACRLAFVNDARVIQFLRTQADHAPAGQD
jgi:hypothetical protein